jgi:hypothetical protein
MIKPEWKDAPTFANHLVVQPGFCGPLYCWVEAWEEGAKAIWHDDLARSWMAFELRKANWTYVEARP